MNIGQGVWNIWNTRDELSPRNFRKNLVPLFLVLPLSIIIGDLRFLDQGQVLFGIDSNNLILMVYGLGFLPILFTKQQNILHLLRISIVVQLAFLVLQFVMEPGTPRLVSFFIFHIANGVCTACGFYYFAFALNNVERLFTVMVSQLYFALTYMTFQFEPVATFFRYYGSAVVMLALVVVVFVAQIWQTEAIALGVGTKALEAKAPDPGLNARDSGVAAIIALQMIYYVISLMAMYIEYQEKTVKGVLYGVGGVVSIAIIIVVMLIFNYSALHLWSLCLVCSVLGIGALFYAPDIAVKGGSVLYGIGEGFGFMIIYYLMGGAIKRSGSFRLLKLWCLFTCVIFVVVSGVFFAFYDGMDAPNLYLAFPAVLVLALVCFLFLPILQAKLFQTDWTDGYHMADIPLYSQALAQVEQENEESALGLTPREMEIFTMLLTEASPKQIAAVLGVSYATVNFHSKNLYRKLNIQSRTELFTNYGSHKPKPS